MRNSTKNHLPISKEMETVLKRHLSAKYTQTVADDIWKNILTQYEAFTKDLPDLGGKRNRHNGPGGTYDCIALFAYYEALNHEPGMDELYEMNCEVFLPAFKKMAGIVNANKSIFRRILKLAFDMTAKADERIKDGYIMKVEPYSRDGVRYHFDRCPVAEFAKAHGYLNIMPAFCNCDYPAMEYINAALIRKHTCANSDVCDYLIVGDESKTAKEHPKETDEQGYWYNVGT